MAYYCHSCESEVPRLCYNARDAYGRPMCNRCAKNKSNGELLVVMFAGSILAGVVLLLSLLRLLFV